MYRLPVIDFHKIFSCTILILSIYYVVLITFLHHTNSSISTNTTPLPRGPPPHQKQTNTIAVLILYDLVDTITLQRYTTITLQRKQKQLLTHVSMQQRQINTIMA